MREIKFRAWDGKKMFQVGSIDFAVDFGPSYHVTDINGLGYIILCKNITQYTGLKDKNGEEIYEGDIVELNVEIHKVPKELNRHVVVFRKGAFVCSENGFYFWDYAEGVNDDTVEVIGNIYENPELLEK